MKDRIPFKKLGLALLAFFLLYTLAGFFLVPVAMKKVIENLTEETLAGTFSAGTVRFNPFTLVSRVEDAKIETGDGGPQLSVGAIHVNLSAVSLFKLAPVISAVRIFSPELFLSTDKTGKLVLPAKLSEPRSQAGNSDNAPFGLRVSDLVLEKGQVTFLDGVRQMTHQIRDASLTLPVISTLEDETGAPVTAEGRLELNKAPIRFSAEMTKFPGPDISAGIQVSGTKMDLAAWLPYVDLPDELEVTSPGELSWDLALKYTPGKEGKAGTSAHHLGVKGRVEVTTVAADLMGQGPLVTIPSLSVVIDSPDLLKDRIGVELVSLEKPEFFLKRDAAGQLPLTRLFSGSGDDTSERASKENHGTPLFSVSLATAEIYGGRVHVRDEAIRGGFETLLSPVSIRVKDAAFSGGRVALMAEVLAETASGERVSVSGQLEREGEVTQIQDGKLVLEGFTPDAYSVYLMPYIGSRAGLDRLDAGAVFELALDATGVHGTVRAGTLDLSGIRLTSAEKAPDIMAVPGLAIHGIEADLDRRRLRIGSFETSGGAVNLRLNETGELNIVAAA